MKETSKASLRRSRDPSFVQRYLVGDGLDIGGKDDPLTQHMASFPLMRSAAVRDASQGSVTAMDGVPDARYDFVHASHILAEQDNPHKALARWLDLLKPGGHAVITVPDEDLYGKGDWPSRFNRNHKASFTICKPAHKLPRSIDVLELVSAMSNVAQCERVTLLRDHYDDQRHSVDQTDKGFAECAIEIVLRKRDVPTARAMLETAAQARSAGQGIAACKDAARTYPYRFDVYHRAMLEFLRWEVPHEADALWDECAKRLAGEHPPQLYKVLHAISRGKLQEGFAMREALMAPFGWRRRTTAQPPHGVAQWTGQPLNGKSIAIWSEFGLGDEIFFLRFARIFRERCGAQKVVVVCQAPLAELYEASGEADEVVSVENVAKLPHVDFWVFPHAIPAWLKLDLEALPSTTPYLRAPEGVPSKLPAASHDKLKVGIVFKGNPTHENDRHRSLPSLAVLDDVFKLEGMEFYSLQKGAGADEAARYASERANFHDVGVALETMAETASAIASLDLVLTVDTSVAHVAGAMGKPVWLMLPCYGDWRWHYTREDSPWYPSMRLFRRRFGADWSEVVARMVGHLQQFRFSMPARLPADGRASGL
ncbi:methyltransferase type 11 (plasmid) [Burkholderia sp. KK1]|nr:methyltransferase type 11 [Burkholderia sp. KK1]